MSNKNYIFKTYFTSLLPVLLKSQVSVAHSGSDLSLSIDLRIKWDNTCKIVLKV